VPLVKPAIALKRKVNDMLSEKDNQFLTYLSTATEAGKIPWQPTATANQFTASLRGKYNVMVGTDRDGPWLRMSNDQDQVMLFISSLEDPTDRVDRIFNAARRIALNVDTAIDEIIQEE
jgi:hypothetical protein